MLSLDYETFSEADLKKVGLDVYSSHPSFEVMMMAYRIDQGPVQHWQAHLEPFPQEIRERLECPHEIKWAFNSQFERIVTRNGLGINTPVEGWRCGMVLAYMRSFMGGLSDIGAQMLIPEDQQKKKNGTKLIRRFCMPQKITKNQRYRRRNYETDPDDWQVFCDYNVGDVVAECAIRDRLLDYPILDDEWLLYELDQRINDRGMPFDRQFAINVRDMSERRRAELLAEMATLTGIDNPNSQVQLLEWLRTQGYPFFDIGSPTMKRALNLNDEGAIQLTPICVEVMHKREWAAKTATKKADTALRTASDDDRIRGMYKFCGASRTGRFSGSLVQPQNMARTPKAFDPEHSSEKLDAVTEMIRQGDYDAFEIMVDEPMGVFGGTMRGMFRAQPGHVLHVCDYSSIESVGLAWAAQCDGILEVFRNKRDMYRSFGVSLYKKPYEEITSAERQICKSACLGCLGSETLVLTDAGWKRIVDVELSDRVFDGVEFVEHSGVIDQGVKSVIDWNGLQITPDHLVLCGDEWWEAKYLNTRLGQQALRSGAGGLLRLYAGQGGSCTIGASVPVVGKSENCTGIIWNSGNRKAVIDAPMPAFLRRRAASIFNMISSRVKSLIDWRTDIMRLSLGVNVAPASLGRVMLVVGSPVDLSMSMSLSDIVSRFPALWMQGLRSTASIITEIMHRVIYGSWTGGYSVAIKRFSVGSPITARQCVQPSSGSGLPQGIEEQAPLCERSGKGFLQSKLSPIRPTVEVRTYDIADCGPRNRFMVWTGAGPVIVHNCGYGLGAGEIRDDGSMTGLLAYAYNMGISMSLEESVAAVAAYRQTYSEVPRFWYACGDAAQAVLEGTPEATVGPFTFSYLKPFLLIRLPSGRHLYYYKPRMETREYTRKVRRWDTEQMRFTVVEETRLRNVMTYMGRNQHNTQWDRIVGYGPSLVENIVQGLCRDILKAGLMRLDKLGFPIVGHSHDEIIVEAPVGSNRFNWMAMREEMTKPIPWLPGMPLGANGWSGEYYRK